MIETQTATFDGTQDDVVLVWADFIPQYRIFATPYSTSGPIPAMAMTDVEEVSAIMTPASRFTGKVDVVVLDLHPPYTPPIAMSSSASSGIVGASITITGRFLTGLTAVTFNGRAAAFVVVDDRTVTATVPAGASTGTLAVAKPVGTSELGTFTVTS